jgi:hypothetical protein
MQGRPRRLVIDEENVGVYHCWARTVRRAWLCGVDPLTGQDFSHRKPWFYERLEELSQIYAVDACVWAILSNHYHLIVRNRPDLVEQWSDEEVARRWWMLYPERKDEQGRPCEPSDLEIRSIVGNAGRIAELRRRLSSISWFMKSVNEWFACRANAEEEQKGHFFQERFSCRNLLDEGAILACSIYIDLNEIRAALASTPEESRNTSAYRRILARILRQARVRERGEPDSGDATDYRPGDPDYWLCPIDERDRAPLLGPESAEPIRGEFDSAVSRLQTATPASNAQPVVKAWRHGFLPLSVDQYLELLDWTGRQWLAGRRGAVDEAYPAIFDRLGLRPAAWLQMIDEFDLWFHGAVGRAERMMQHSTSTGRRWVQGLRACRAAFW